MTDELSLSWTEARAAAKRTTHQRVLGLNLAVYAVVALVAIFVPATLADVLDLPEPAGWIQGWGGLLLLAALLYIPALLDPVRVRWSNAIGIAGRFALAVLYIALGGGFLWLALGEALFG